MNPATDNEQESGWWASDEGDGSQTVYLYRKENGTQSLLDRYTVDPESMPTLEEFKFAIKEQHGGGIYEATIRTPTGQLVKRIPFSLAGLPKRQIEPVAANTVPAPATASDDRLEKVLLMMVDQNRQNTDRMAVLLTAIEKLSQRPPETPADPFLMFERAASFLSAKGATPPPPKTLLEQMLEVKQVGELMGLNTGTKGGETDGWGALTALAGPLMEVVKEGTVNDRLKLQLALDRQKAAGQSAPTAVQVQPVASGQFQALLAGFAPVLPQLVQAAAAGHPAAQVAKHLLGIVPADDVPTLRAFLDRDTALTEMMSLAPDIAEHFEWFEELANTLIELIDGAADEAGTPQTQSAAQPAAVRQGADTGRPARNAPHPATDGRPDTRRAAKPSHPGASAGAGVGIATEGLPE